MKMSVLVLICFIALCNISTAATYYVATTGDNGNPGTEAQPWLTVQKAADTMTAGDTTIVKNGTYAERPETKASGTDVSTITFQAESTNTVLGAFDFKHAYNRLVGFTVTGNSAVQKGAVTLYAGGNNCTILSNEFGGTPANIYSIYANDGAPRPTNSLISSNRFVGSTYHCLTLFGASHQIIGNYFTSPNGWDAIRPFGDNIRIAYNTFTNWSNLTTNGNHTDLMQSFTDHGLADTSVTNVIVEKNLGINCWFCQVGNFTDDDQLNWVKGWIWRNNVFVRVCAALNIYAPDFQFYNNTFYRCSTNSAVVIAVNVDATRGLSHGFRAYNNIFLECGDDPSRLNYCKYYLDPSLTNYVTDYNLVRGTGAGTSKTDFTETHGLNGIDPQLSDIDTGDASLLVGSACIGAGIELNSYFTDDFAGVTRGAEWDIGAYEYEAGETPEASSRLLSGKVKISGRVIIR